MRQARPQDPGPRPPHDADPLNGFARVITEGLHALGRAIRDYRTELTAIVTLIPLVFIVKDSPILIGWPILLLVLTGTYFGREQVLQLLHAGTVKREWRHATEDCGLHDQCRKVTRAAAGDRLDIKIARGRSITGLEAKTDELAACLRVGEIRIQRNPSDASHATVTLVRHDPFKTMKPVPWPGLHPNSKPSVWDPIRVGTNEEGEPLYTTLVGNQILVGGTTGGGKSVYLRSLLGTAALDPDAKLWLFDAKYLELGPWAPAAEQFVGPDGPRAVQVLQELHRVSLERQQEVLATGADKIRRNAGLPVHVIVVDELSEFATMPEGKEIMTLLRSIASRGRALGITVVAATQSPYADVIDSALRTQFKTRVVFRCMDRGHASTIVGNSPIANLAPMIPDTLPGVGYAVDESGTFTRFRSVFIGRADDDDPDRDDDVLAIVRRATGDRLDEGLAVLLGLPGGQVETPKGSSDGNGKTATSGNGKNGNGRRKPGTAPRLVSEVERLLGEEPVKQSAVAVKLGRHPGDGAVRRALTALEEQGKVKRTEDGLWVKT